MFNFIQKSENLTVPRGRLFFGELSSDGRSVTKWIDLGNCPDATFTASFDTVNEFDSVNGKLVLSEVHITAAAMSCRIVTDDMKQTNLALWGNHSVFQSQIQNQNVNVTFQLNGQNFVLFDYIPDSNLTIIDNRTRTWVRGIDYEYDEYMNGIHILNGNFQATADSLNVSYITISRLVTSQSFDLRNKSVEGVLRFVSYNPVGPRYNYVFHRVVLKPAQSHTIIGNPNSINWATLELDVQVMKRHDQEELYSMTKIERAVLTWNGRVIVDSQNRAHVTVTQT